MLDYIYKQALQWAYVPVLFPLPPKPEIVQVLQNDLKQAVDYDSFIGYFYLWRYVMTKIYSFFMSQWNAAKGVSDTISKLVWINIHNPPCNTVQDHAVARMILIMGVIIHRLNHFFTANQT